MFDPHPNLTRDVIHGLGWLYLILALMNLAWAFRSFNRDGLGFHPGFNSFNLDGFGFLLSLNCLNFDFAECCFSEKSMTVKEWANSKFPMSFFLTELLVLASWEVSKPPLKLEELLKH